MNLLQIYMISYNYVDIIWELYVYKARRNKYENM